MSDATRLDEAKDALHDLIRGQQVREIQDQNGERVAYTRTDIPALRTYIAELERACSPDAVGSRAPMQFFF